MLQTSFSFGWKPAAVHNLTSFSLLFLRSKTLNVSEFWPLSFHKMINIKNFRLTDRWPKRSLSTITVASVPPLTAMFTLSSWWRTPGSSDSRRTTINVYGNETTQAISTGCYYRPYWTFMKSRQPSRQHNMFALYISANLRHSSFLLYITLGSNCITDFLSKGRRA